MHHFNFHGLGISVFGLHLLFIFEVGNLIFSSHILAFGCATIDCQLSPFFSFGVHNNWFEHNFEGMGLALMASGFVSSHWALVLVK